MGCGLSTMDPECATTNRHSNPLRRYKIVRPAGDKKPLDVSEEGSDISSRGKKDGAVVMKPLGEQEMKGNQEEKTKEKDVLENQKTEKVINNGGNEKVRVKGGNVDHRNNEKTEQEDDREDDISNGPGSPSFREYCVGHNPKHSSSRNKKFRELSFNHYFNDNSSESTKNEVDDDSTKTMNKPQKEESSNSNKVFDENSIPEHENKERRGRGFRNIIHKGRQGTKKNFLIFSCYISHESYAEGPRDKIIEKAA
ncbi:hypothetical protein L6164_004921 [Bauhinia variegata]|uniref:Uncharacterized protein n=1 Tax=Bauhinia variegata TaxID=167791 RepID=A0ACB9PR28_BAUVA|nr:hypothetical protein L6164_004921 [Bauhinia variegata]